MEASLFDDNVDIFADLTMSSGAKDKPKKKMDTKSIFDDDMGNSIGNKKKILMCDRFQITQRRPTIDLFWTGTFKREQHEFT